MVPSLLYDPFFSLDTDTDGDLVLAELYLGYTGPIQLSPVTGRLWVNGRILRTSAG